MKHEWKKEEKDLYHIKNTPAAITVPEQKYLTIHGRGNPNDSDFAARVGVLYSLAYQIKMRHKNYCLAHPQLGQAFACQDYSVYPLEGVWTAADDNPLDKSGFIYTIMIRQPDLITDEMFQEALLIAAKKKPHLFLQEVSFVSMSDDLCVHVLHKGTYDDEPNSFAVMDQFCREHNFERIAKSHREIYLTDASRTAPANNRTILRYQVKCI